MPKPPAPWFNPTKLAKSALGIFASASIQGAVCLTVGGALAYAAILLRVPPWYVPLALFAGMAIPLWPLRVYFSPERVLERRYAQWDGWVKRRVITQAQCTRWKKELREWYGAQITKPDLTGQPVPELATVDDSDDGID